MVANPDQVLIFDTTLRSEEHTSELQSQSNLVCRLLLEKKKTHDDGEEPVTRASAVICSVTARSMSHEHSHIMSLASSHDALIAQHNSHHISACGSLAV